MSADAGTNLPSVPPGGSPGVMDAVRMGWRLLAQDFWQLWLAALVVVGILGGIEVAPCISCLAPVAGVFLWPAMMAGLFLVVRDRADGAAVRFNRLFTAFQRCYWPAVVAGLPVTLTGLVVGILSFAVRFALGMAVGMWGGMSGRFSGPAHFNEQMAALYAADGAAVVAQKAVEGIVGLFFMFAMLAIWEHPGEGWQAARRSLGLVTGHFGAALGFGLVFAGLWLAATVAGVLACCVGRFFTMSVFQAWHAGATLYLYRSWTGQALVQPPAAEVAAGGTVEPQP
ncbi:MAG: hypothetical protein FJ288_05980 [Planctomycetes bacterium]|nr:hypothetical protein [Planctomycetota bacterium]